MVDDANASRNRRAAARNILMDEFTATEQEQYTAKEQEQYKLKEKQRLQEEQRPQKRLHITHLSPSIQNGKNTMVDPYTLGRDGASLIATTDPIVQAAGAAAATTAAAAASYGSTVGAAAACNKTNEPLFPTCPLNASLDNLFGDSGSNNRSFDLDNLQAIDSSDQSQTHPPTVKKSYTKPPFNKKKGKGEGVDYKTMLSKVIRRFMIQNELNPERVNMLHDQ